MKIFSTKLILLGILCRIYLTTAKSSGQSAAIISGTQAALGQFPWHVLFKIKTGRAIQLCAGSLISNKWVLTAAHCIYNISNNLVMAFGTIELRNNPINMTSTKFFIHPAYKPNVLTDDIGLIELPTPLNFTDNIKAIDLVSSTETSNDFLAAQGTISGFGATKDKVDIPSDWLLWTTVEILNNSVCAQMFHIPNDNRTMCGKGWNGSNQSPCYGDSGGALVWKNQFDKFVQIGIVSFAKRNCSNFPSSYVRLTTYLDYIRNITGIKFD
ncbi:collagenase-like [Lucilia sericata]|uniref:collagenase-like n=1 Tax=Lucilia sericata TaxID=13632 RepID=UPI0018A84A79|nr:collagenase-like [Lucilia sericata]